MRKFLSNKSYPTSLICSTRFVVVVSFLVLVVWFLLDIASSCATPIRNKMTLNLYARCMCPLISVHDEANLSHLCNNLCHQVTYAIEQYTLIVEARVVVMMIPHVSNKERLFAKIWLYYNQPTPCF